VTLTIRQAQPDDRERWGELFRAYGVFYETEFSDAVLDGVWAWIVDTDHVLNALVAEVNGSVIGLGHYRSMPDTFSAGTEWYLDDLFVDPSARGTGAATALIERLKEIAATTNGTLRWITAADNATAQRVYDKVATKATWVTYEVRP
jgi:GNAT superfamily N-acetyltransferase